MPGTVISIENLSKSYRLGVIGTGTFYGDVQRWWALRRGLPDPYLKVGEVDPGNRQGDTIWALKDINFEVKQAEILGIIGRNGAGKSTLLKILSQVTAPTTGVVKTKGRVASLLEVGTGFHPELTGRENVYLNGAILGMNRFETRRKFDEIVEFSGVGKFIDTPVKRYSSGMYVRLAFAVAAHLDPEILVVDEVLAVGDAAFQKKSLGKMGEVAQQGRTVLFVSHNMGAISNLCTRALLIENGRLSLDGEASAVVSTYQTSTAAGAQSIHFEPIHSEAFFINAAILDKSFHVSNDIGVTEPFVVELEYTVTKSLRNADVAFILHDKSGTRILTCSLSDINHQFLRIHPPGTFTARVTIPAEFLAPGTYFITPAIHEYGRKLYDQKNQVLQFRIVETGSIRYKMMGADMGSILVRFPWDIQECQPDSKETS